MEMRNTLVSSIVALAPMLAFSSVAVAQVFSGAGQVEQRPKSLYQTLENAGGTGGPAPARDLTGFWTGPLEPKLGPAPPLTALGQARFKANIPDPFSVHSNDPWGTCDPFGFPRSATNETRGVAFAQMPGRIVILTQYQRVFRTVWMDGRPLPKNAGAKGGPDATWYGYSVGHWDGDNTLVVETNGVDDRSWVDRRGYPHSVDMRVEERYTRLNHDVLELTVTIDDPKIYTKPFVVATNRFRWIPNQEDEEQLCVPSEMISYFNTIALPANQDEVTGKKK
jgi:hypothetical protein